MPHEAGRVTDPNRVSRERAVDATRSISPRVWNDRYAFVPIMPQDRGNRTKDVASHTSPMRPAVPQDVTLVSMGRP